MSKQPRTATWEHPFVSTFALFVDGELGSIGIVRRAHAGGRIDGNRWRSCWRERAESAPITLREAVRRIEAWAARERITITNPGMPIEEAGK